MVDDEVFRGWLDLLLPREDVPTTGQAAVLRRLRLTYALARGDWHEESDTITIDDPGDLDALKIRSASRNDSKAIRKMLEPLGFRVTVRSHKGRAYAVEVQSAAGRA